MTHTNGFAALAASVAALLAVAARAGEVEDSQFLRDAIQTDISEVKMCELALQRSNDDGVRDFAHRLQTDHSASMQATAAVAKDLGTRIPSAPSDEALQHYATLAKLSGHEFDAAFVNRMVAEHRDSVTKFGEQTHANPNQAILDLAVKTLPTLQQHLALGESLLGAHPSAQAQGPPEGERGALADPQLRGPPPEPSIPPPL